MDQSSGGCPVRVCRSLFMPSDRVLPPSLDFSHARCISLLCYSIQGLGPHVGQQGESRHGFESLRPVPWTKILPVFSFSMNDESLSLFPPDEVRLRLIL